MLDQEVGSMIDKKTNEDFNSVDPDHYENGLTKGNSDIDEKNSTKKLKLKNKYIHHG